MMVIGANSLAIPSCLPSFICWTFTHWGGCRSQSLSLRPASRYRCHGLAAFSPWLPADDLHLRRHSDVSPYVCDTIISIPPVKPCRRRRHFSPRMRFNRFVFLNLPVFSLGDHLGVTASPQSPLPAGYVTLPVDSRSPPLGLMPPHSRGQGILLLLLSPLHSRHTLSRMTRDEAHCKKYQPSNISKCTAISFQGFVDRRDRALTACSVPSICFPDKRVFRSTVPVPIRWL